MYAAMRKVDRTRHVTRGIELRTAHIEDDESVVRPLDGDVHVPAIGLEFQKRLIVRERARRWCRRNVGPRPELDVDWYRFSVCSFDDGPLMAMGGVTVVPTAGLRALRQAG